ncbi:MAG: hypothetical protein GEU82_18100, partial [Luteitalea sp.]|nr:hypothetical protein [Luteitalea sp.]
MITPRQTRLIRVPDLHVFRETIAALAAEGRFGDATSRVVIVPTRGAAGQLRTTIERLVPAAPIPLLLTREQLYETWHARLVDPPRRLSAFERDSLAQAAASHAARESPQLPFKVRPGLVSEILRFYDHLRRQSQQVGRFEELIVEALGGSQGDRGAERLLLQTRFIAGTFREYERRVAATGACDEHTLRDRLLGGSATAPLAHVIVTTPDWIADPAGLFVADFDLLARIPHLQALDIVATEGVLASGFHERILNWWPGLEELDGLELRGVRLQARPSCTIPADADDELWFTHRDREEELIACARRLAAADEDPVALERAAIVFKRPLPYLYLAPDVFREAGLPYRVSDSLPLAAEPAVAAVDLVLEAVETRFARTAMIALLRSPHFRVSETPMGLAAISALDRALSDKRYLGGLERLEQLAESFEGDAARAISAALPIARGLSAMLEPAPASVLIARLLDFLDSRHALLDADGPSADRERRARAAVNGILSALSAAHADHYDPTWSFEDLSAAVR